MMFEQVAKWFLIHQGWLYIILAWADLDAFSCCTLTAYPLNPQQQLLIIDTKRACRLFIYPIGPVELFTII
jgi:hypothetical protein